MILSLNSACNGVGGKNEYSGVKYITRPAIGNQSSVFVEITIPANRKSLYLINPYNEIIRHLV